LIVLDTHIRHWWTNQIAGKLTSPQIALIEEADEIAVSAISSVSRWLGCIDTDASILGCRSRRGWLR
jgi:hypothetical protein